MSAFRAKVVIRGYKRNHDPDDGTVKIVTLPSGVLAAEVRSELVLRAAFSDTSAVLASDPSLDGAWLLLEARAPGAAPWLLVRELRENAWSRSLPPIIKLGIGHPRLLGADQCRFVNRERLADWLEVEIDAALEKGLLSGR